MKAYKGFNEDMTCRGFQFEEGKTYELPEGQEAKLCESGFHACEYPLDVFNYYPPATSVYHEVEQSGKLDKKYGDSKVASTKIKIGAEISIAGMVKAAIEYTMERAHEVKGGRATGDLGAASATGDLGAASATGNYGAASATGYQGAASATSNYGAASATGDSGVAVVSGRWGKAMGALGCAICICERGNWNGRTYPIIAVKAAIVDGEEIRPGVWYTLKDGEFVEVDGGE